MDRGCSFGPWAHVGDLDADAGGLECGDRLLERGSTRIVQPPYTRKVQDNRVNGWIVGKFCSTDCFDAGNGRKPQYATWRDREGGAGDLLVGDHIELTIEMDTDRQSHAHEDASFDPGGKGQRRTQRAQPDHTLWHRYGEEAGDGS